MKLVSSYCSKMRMANNETGPDVEIIDEQAIIEEESPVADVDPIK